MGTKPRQYIDFKLYITSAPDGNGICQVSLLPTPEVGETMKPVSVAADKGPSADMLPLIAGKGITLRKLVEFGKGLANWLLPDEKSDGQETIRELFADALKKAGNTGGVRLRLIITDAGLRQWPWEYTYFDSSGTGGPDSMSGFLALDPRISIVRHEPLTHPHPTGKEYNADINNLRMVIAAASPRTQIKLDVDKELGFITGALKNFNVDGIRLTTVPVPDATPLDVAGALQGAGSTFIFHFAGHGITEAAKRDPFTPGETREEGFLYFLDDKTKKTECKVRADDLALRLQAAGVRLAVFGACYSGMRSGRYPWDGIAGALTKRDIPASVTMQYEVMDSHAIAFTRSFYGNIAAGLSLDEAMSAGRLAMYGVTSDQPDQPGFLEWGVPVLYSRMTDGRLFPECMEKSGETANKLRTVIQQTVDTITETGEVVGIEGNLSGGTFEVSQKAGTVKGKLKGVVLKSPGSGMVKQDADTVSGNMTGMSIDSI